MIFRARNSGGRHARRAPAAPQHAPAALAPRPPATLGGGGRLSAELASVQAELREVADAHDQLLEAVLLNADEDINGGDEAPEYLAEAYVRWLEAERDKYRKVLGEAADRYLTDVDEPMPDSGTALYLSAIARLSAGLRDVQHACERGDAAHAVAPVAAGALAYVDRLQLPAAPVPRLEPKTGTPALTPQVQREQAAAYRHASGGELRGPEIKFTTPSPKMAEQVAGLYGGVVEVQAAHDRTTDAEERM